MTIFENDNNIPKFDDDNDMTKIKDDTDISKFDDDTDHYSATTTSLDPSPRRTPWGYYLQQGWLQLWQQRQRNALVSAGLIVGVAALVCALTLALTAQSVVVARLGGYPVDVLSISAVTNHGTVTHPLRIDDVAALVALPSIQQSSPVTTITTEIAANDQHTTVNIAGVASTWNTIQQWNVADGNWFSRDDEQVGRPVAVLGMSLAIKLFHDTSDAIDQTVTIQGQPYTVRGVLDARSPTTTYTSDSAVYLPYSTFTYRIQNVPTVSSIIVQASSGVSTSVVKDDVTALLRQRHQLAPNATNDFRVQTASDASRATQQSVQFGIVVLGVIAVVALLLGGVALMLAIVAENAERHEEILLLRTLGARPSDIASQRIVEMLVVCAVAGVVGSILAEVTLALGFHWLTLPFLFSPLAIIAGLVAALLVGLICSLSPSRQAGQTSIVVAMRMRW